MMTEGASTPRSHRGQRQGLARGLRATALLGLVSSVSASACGGHARGSASADMGGSAFAGGADSGPLPVNEPRSRLACGATSTCFVTARAQVLCWGTGAEGQLGNGSTDEAPMGPAPVMALPGTSGLIGSPLQTCAFATDDTAKCWGLLPARVATATPAPTPLDLKDVATVASSGHACAVTRAGDVYCWGPDEFLGNGTGPSESPTQVLGLHDAIDVAVAKGSELGSGVATLVVRADGTVVGWGHAHGPGLTDQSGRDTFKPNPMPGLTGVKQITLGLNHACALLQDATVACWGSNEGGRLGASGLMKTLVPQVVNGLSDVAEVRAGETSTCARRANGEVWCWGDNTFETLALPKALPFSRVPVRVDVPPVADMAVGPEHICVLVGDDRVWCWGSNYSNQISDSAQSTIDTPLLVMP